MKKIMIFAAVATMFAACSKEMNENVTLSAPADKYFATVGDCSRVQLDGENRIVWNAGDEVSVFTTSGTNLCYVFDGADGASEGTLTIKEGSTTEDGVVAAYPYNEDYTFVDGYLTKFITETQTYAAGTFASDATLMVATCDAGVRDLSFKNVFGWIKISLNGTKTVTSITLAGNNNEQLTGIARVNVETLESSFIEGLSGETLTIDCGEGIDLGGETKAFYFGVVPQNFTNGITVTINYSTGSSEELSTSKAVNVARNHIVPMAAPAPAEWVRVSGATFLDLDWDDTKTTGVELYRFGNTNEFKFVNWNGNGGEWPFTWDTTTNKCDYTAVQSDFNYQNDPGQPMYFASAYYVFDQTGETTTWEELEENGYKQPYFDASNKSFHFPCYYAVPAAGSWDMGFGWGEEIFVLNDGVYVDAQLLLPSKILADASAYKDSECLSLFVRGCHMDTMKIGLFDTASIRSATEEDLISYLQAEGEDGSALIARINSEDGYGLTTFTGLDSATSYTVCIYVTNGDSAMFCKSMCSTDIAVTWKQIAEGTYTHKSGFYYSSTSYQETGLKMYQGQDDTKMYKIESVGADINVIFSYDSSSKEFYIYSSKTKKTASDGDPVYYGGIQEAFGAWGIDDATTQNYLKNYPCSYSSSIFGTTWTLCNVYYTMSGYYIGKNIVNKDTFKRTKTVSSAEPVLPWEKENVVTERFNGCMNRFNDACYVKRTANMVAAPMFVGDMNANATTIDRRLSKSAVK